jgi:glycosyltransferase involved in cell wall biosynthesis
MQKIRIVYINKYFFPMERHSGILNFAYDLCNNLAERFDLKVISWKYSDNVKSIEDLNNYSVSRVSFPFRIKSAFLAKHLKPDLVIFGSGIKYPVILLFVTLFLKLVYASIPIVIYQHSVPFFSKIPLSCFFNKICAGFWFSNPFNKEKIIKKIYGKAVYVPVGIDPQRLETIPKEKGKNVRIGYFGHLNEAKGVDVLVNAFLKLDIENCELFMAGTGSLMRKIKELTEDKKNISIYGFCNDVLSYMKSCDILVFPYRDAVSVLGLSLSCLEAMILGKPIIASNNITLTPLVRHNYNGFIFDNDDEIVRYLNLLIKDEEKRKIMGGKSIEIASDYSIEKVTKQISKIIKEIVNERRN